MAIFRFFKMAAAAILNFKIFNGRTRRSNCITVPNFNEIARTAVEISQFWNFSKWRPTPSWISKFLNF